MTQDVFFNVVYTYAHEPRTKSCLFFFVQPTWLLECNGEGIPGVKQILLSKMSTKCLVNFVFKDTLRFILILFINTVEPKSFAYCMISVPRGAFKLFLASFLYSLIKRFTVSTHFAIICVCQSVSCSVRMMNSVSLCRRPLCSRVHIFFFAVFFICLSNFSCRFSFFFNFSFFVSLLTFPSCVDFLFLVALLRLCFYIFHLTKVFYAINPLPPYLFFPHIIWICLLWDVDYYQWL